MGLLFFLCFSTCTTFLVYRFLLLQTKKGSKGKGLDDEEGSEKTEEFSSREFDDDFVIGGGNPIHTYNDYTDGDDFTDDNEEYHYNSSDSGGDRGINNDDISTDYPDGYFDYDPDRDDDDDYERYLESQRISSRSVESDTSMRRALFAKQNSSAKSSGLSSWITGN